MGLWGTNKSDRARGLWCCGSEDMGVYRDSGNANGLVFLCTTTTVTALATGLYKGNLMTQCSTTSTLSSTPTSTPASTPISTSASTPTSTVSDGEGSSVEVPTGAIAGGVLGGIAGIAIVVIGVHFFFFKKKRKDRPEQPSAQISAQEGHLWHHRFRVDSQRRRASELETVEPRLEMNGVKPTYELDATEEQGGVFVFHSTVESVE
ncbi:hypothetical protein GQ607_012377 [Colletotrichum asianum]|uniref:Uncharacterized protein n=1 Tax=Colletotrichum asianum TaxID=702518 RepID=A0A8H3W789_9PEZI|nr:hypothetical protein GQ607_012377 [Colletotrichum asianum]